MINETDQIEAFPMTKVECAELLLTHFQSDVESAEKSLINARTKLRAAIELRNAAETHLIRMRGDGGEEAPADVSDDAMQVENVPLQLEGEVEDAEFVEFDPITGEVQGKPEVAPHVLVAWPGNPDLQTITVGPLTRYGELVADYLADAGFDDGSLQDYRIIDADAGSERDLSATITAADYGLVLSVEPLNLAEESAA